MFSLAQAMFDRGEYLRRDVANKYENVKWRIAGASISIETPHFVDSYIFLTERKD